MKCTDPDIGRLLERYLLSRLDRNESRRFEDHLFECSFCRWALQDEDVLWAFTRKHQKNLCCRLEPDNFLMMFHEFLDSLAVLRMNPELPFQSRGSARSAVPIRDLNLHTVNLSGMQAVCNHGLTPTIQDDRLCINGFIREMTDREIFLLLCQKSDILSLDADNTGQIRTVIEEMGCSFVFDRRMDLPVREVLGRSFVIKGMVQKNRVELPLSQIGLSYIRNPEYIAIVVVT